MHQYVELPTHLAKERARIVQHKQNILAYREQFIATRLPALIRLAEEEQEEVLTCRRMIARYERETVALREFLEALLQPVTTITKSPFLEDICSNVFLLTMFYIAAAFFFMFDHKDEMYNYIETLYNFLWR